MRYMAYCGPSAVGDRSNAPTPSTCRSAAAPYGDSSGAPAVVTTERPHAGRRKAGAENTGASSGVSTAVSRPSFARPQRCWAKARRRTRSRRNGGRGQGLQGVFRFDIVGAAGRASVGLASSPVAPSRCRGATRVTPRRGGGRRAIGGGRRAREPGASGGGRRLRQHDAVHHGHVAQGGRKRRHSGFGDGDSQVGSLGLRRRHRRAAARRRRAARAGGAVLGRRRVQ